MIESVEDAMVLIASVRAALKNGVVHFNKEGYVLIDEKEIIECMKEEGGVEIDESDRGEIVTVEEVLEQVKRDFARQIG